MHATCACPVACSLVRFTSCVPRRRVLAFAVPTHIVTILVIFGLFHSIRIVLDLLISLSVRHWHIKHYKFCSKTKNPAQALSDRIHILLLLSFQPIVWFVPSVFLFGVADDKIDTSISP